MYEYLLEHLYQLYFDNLINLMYEHDLKNLHLLHFDNWISLMYEHNLKYLHHLFLCIYLDLKIIVYLDTTFYLMQYV